MKPHKIQGLFLLLISSMAVPAHGADWVEYHGGKGSGAGKRIVFLAGDEEYRSEEGLPMLAKILARRHGFNCTVLFSINPADGTIDPMNQTNIPGMEALDSADLCVMQLRFRELPDSQMAHLVNYVDTGKPIVALRTSTHAFMYERNKTSPYAKWDWRSKEWPGGFGQQVLGETWVNHHGNHGKESTHGVINRDLEKNPILRGVGEIWCPADVYTVTHLPKDSNVLVWGEVLSGMKPTDPPVEGSKNNPLMPLAWTWHYWDDAGQSSRIFTTTAGAAVDFEDENFRRLLVNACYWAVGMEKQIPAKADVNYVGEYKPDWFGTDKFKKGVKPADLAIP